MPTPRLFPILSGHDACPAGHDFPRGVDGISDIILKGSSWVVLKTEGKMQERAYQAARIFMRGNIVRAVIYFFTLTCNYHMQALSALFPAQGSQPTD